MSATPGSSQLAPYTLIAPRLEDVAHRLSGGPQPPPGGLFRLGLNPIQLSEQLRNPFSQQERFWAGGEFVSPRLFRQIGLSPEPRDLRAVLFRRSSPCRYVPALHCL
ncbi:hypothetical protein MRX96_015124 [Rhipicephalus microplus]